MKLFWKIFFSAVILSTACVLISGHGVISSGFQAQLSKEAETAEEYGVILSQALFSELGETIPRGNGGKVKQILRGPYWRTMDQAMPFAVLDEEGGEILSSREDWRGPILPGLSDSTAGWTVTEAEGRFWLWAARPVRAADGSLIFVEVGREVTDIYQAQRQQYEKLARSMAGMSVIITAAAFFLTRFLLRDVNDLIKVTREIAGGNMKVRAIPRRQDEISALSQNFNVMAERLDAKMRQLQEEAERKELFVGAFSHELKTPLTSIIGYADLLRQRKLDGEQQRLCAEYIFSEGKRLERLSMRLLELIVLRKRRAKVEAVDVRGLLRGVRRSVEPRLKGRNIDLSWQVAPAKVRMEADLMETVFLNLMDNAGKAIDGAGGIDVRGVLRGCDYVVTVRDSGRGMTDDERAKAMNPFFMADKSRARSQGGAGLGLAICDEILKIHGFTLEFDSEIGKGTCATVTMKGAVE